MIYHVPLCIDLMYATVELYTHPFMFRFVLNR
jgi:hypothetical protein